MSRQEEVSKLSKKVTDAIRKTIRAAGYECRTRTEWVAADLRRIKIYSSIFQSMDSWDRDKYVWRIANSTTKNRSSLGWLVVIYTYDNVKRTVRPIKR